MNLLITLTCVLFSFNTAFADSKPCVQMFFDGESKDLHIEKEFSVNGQFYTHSEQHISPQTGYYRLSVVKTNGETIQSNPFTVSDDFSREAFAFCCDEPDTQVITSYTMTVIDGIAD